MTGYVIGKALVFVVLGLVGLVGAVGRARRRAAVRAKIQAAPSTFEDNALVTFTGTVKQLGKPLVAPLSGKPCIAFCATARTYTVRKGVDLTNASRMLGSVAVRNSRELDHEVSATAMVPFVLVTKTGEVFIDGTTCQLLAPGEPIIPRKLDREQQFLASHGLDARAAGAGFDEARIEVGAKIKVHGVSRSELAAAGGETGFREAPTQIRLTGDDAHPLTIDRA